MQTVSSALSEVAFEKEPELVFYDALLRDSKQRAVPAPGFSSSVSVADTHAHLDMLHHPGLALARAAAHTVNFVVTVIDPAEDPALTLNKLESWQGEAEHLLQKWALAETKKPDNADSSGSAACANNANNANSASSKVMQAPEVRITIGCHPHNASAYNQAIEETLVQALMTDVRVVSIGEIGLDYHYDKSPRDVQQQVFRRQIQLAHEHGSSVCLHLREAHKEGLRILKEEGVPAKGLLLHCFNLDYATLEPFLELGAVVAFGGPLTFKKSDEVRDAAARTPLERLVTETDCPFMAPVPVRGSVCEPASVVFTAEVLAGLRAEPQALEQFYATARAFFS